MSKHIFFLAFICCLVFSSCDRKTESFVAEIDLPITDSIYVNLFNLSKSTTVYNDYLSDSVLKLDSLKYGIYLLSISWQKDLISVDEFRSLKPNTVNLNKEHVVQKVLFVDQSNGTEFRVYVDSGISQEKIEQQLANRDNVFDLNLDIKKGKLTRLYDSFEQISHRHKVNHANHVDSLKQMLYAYNNEGNFVESKRINQQIKSSWDNIIVPIIHEEEQQFLLNNKEEIITPFILLLRVTDKQSFILFKDVITQLPENFKNIEAIRDFDRYNND